MSADGERAGLGAGEGDGAATDFCARVEAGGQIREIEEAHDFGHGGHVVPEGVIHSFASRWGEPQPYEPAISRIALAIHQMGGFQPGHRVLHPHGRESRGGPEVRPEQGLRLAGAQGGQDLEARFRQASAGQIALQRGLQQLGCRRVFQERLAAQFFRRPGRPGGGKEDF